MIFCTTEKTSEVHLFIEEIKWSLDRYLRTEETKIKRALKPMDIDLGNGINLDLICNLLNTKKNCFDFDYEPMEKDRLSISNEINQNYFALMFRDGKWTKGDYYTTKLPYKGVRVISERIREGKISKHLSQAQE